MPDKTTDKADFHRLKKEQREAEAELNRIADHATKPGKGKPDKQEGVGTAQRRMG
jgi:hypothetical protein